MRRRGACFGGNLALALIMACTVCSQRPTSAGEALERALDMPDWARNRAGGHSTLRSAATDAEANFDMHAPRNTSRPSAKRAGQIARHMTRFACCSVSKSAA
mmetsp:Transcript_2456/g.6549  ORF Transcript_2456/g.6549 Transcript_2456/m.6549 type:complete len:102 (+) Transcript_2456:500-805(+)